jgi:four helix bundle protein
VAGCRLPELGSFGRNAWDARIKIPLAWQKAMDLVTATYRATAKFPKDELLGLTSQRRRAAVSIPSNIAEGHGRLSEKEFRYFLGQSRGSLMEVETQLQIAQNLGDLEESDTRALLNNCAEVGRILNGLIASICRPPDTGC